MAGIPTIRSGQVRMIMELFSDPGAPLTNLFLELSMKGMSSRPYLCRWVGLKWQIHSKIPISLNFWIFPSTSNQRRSSISSSLTVSYLLVLVSVIQPAKLLEPFLTPWTTTLNAESLLSDHISITSAWSNFTFLPPLSHILSIHSRMFPGFMLI